MTWVTKLVSELRRMCKYWEDDREHVEASIVSEVEQLIRSSFKAGYEAGALTYGEELRGEALELRKESIKYNQEKAFKMLEGTL